MVLLHDMVLMFGYTTIKIFSLPQSLSTIAPCAPESPAPPTSEPLNDSTPQPTFTSLLPSAEYRWRWRIDTLSVAPVQHAHAAPNSRARKRPPVNIFVRFGSWYPWPINMLHHYVLVPSSDPTSNSYTLPPSLALYTYSTLELFAMSDTALGPYGTALWTDSHTSAAAQAEGKTGGQRIAGKVLSHRALVAPEAAQEYVPDMAEAMSDGTAGRYDRGHTMLFRTYERTEAYHLAMDEEAGRIAVASRDGSVTVWDYLPESI